MSKNKITYTEKQRVAALEIVAVCARIQAGTFPTIDSAVQAAQNLQGAIKNLDIVEANLAPKTKKKKRSRKISACVDNDGGR